MNPPQGLSLALSVALPPECSIGVLDSVSLAVGLDLLDATIPGVPFPQLTRPVAKLVLDVGGRGDAGGGDRQLAALCEDALGDGQLLPRRARRDGGPTP